MRPPALTATCLALTLTLGGTACMAQAPAKALADAKLAAQSRPTFTGDIRRHPAFASKFLPDARDLWVYLPPSYEANPTRRYPVLYMHDGNNLFDAHSAFVGVEWGMDETAQRMITSGELPPFIIVGVSNTPARMDEYNWVRGTYQGQPMGGKGERYARTLVEEIKPFIDKTYRTQSDRLHTGVMGSSLGGLISLYLLLHDGDTFGMVGVMSPSVFWADRAVLKDVAAARTDARVYVDIGTAEDGDAHGDEETVADARSLVQVLSRDGYQLGSTLAYVEDPGAHHNEAAWAHRAPGALKFLFGR